ncbi:MAG: CHASE3 domain-containing protein [Armatimonadota bacterium]
MEKTSNKRVVILFFILALIIILTVKFIFYQNFTTFVKNSKQAIHTLEILIKIKRIQDMSLKAEIGKHEFVITGKDKYLRAYYSLKKNVDSEIDELQKLTEDNSFQEKQIKELRDLIDKKLTAFEKCIALKKSGESDINTQISITDEDEAISKDIVKITADIKKEEQDLFEKRASMAYENGIKAMRGAFVGGGLSILILIIIFYILIREIKQRENYAEELKIKDKAMQSSISGIILADPDGKINYANDSFLKMFGYDDINEVAGDNISKLTKPEILEETIKKGSWVYESAAPKKDGSLIDLMISISAVKNESGDVISLMGSFSNITEYKHIEKEMVELNEKLVNSYAMTKTANKELESFSYSVSHDLRSPLRAVHGFAQILKEEYIHEMPSEAQRYMNLIIDNTEQMGLLIDDLLKFSRLSRQKLKKQNINTNNMVRQIIKDMSYEFETGGTEVSVGELPSCYADEVLLKQAWINLISNAVKFTKGQDNAKIEIGSYKKSDVDVYFIKDNGAGFDMKYYDKLFGAFQRLHLPEEYEGTGVGLALAQRIIHRHGGYIWAEGEPDKGAIFYFILEGGTL